MEGKKKDNNDGKEKDKEKNKQNNKNNERRNRFNGITNYELLKIVKQTTGFPKSLSKNIPLETIVNFYDRFWNGEASDDESGSSYSVSDKTEENTDS